MIAWLNMGGYALYVWLSYGMVFSGMLGMMSYIRSIERAVQRQAYLETKRKHASYS